MSSAKNTEVKEVGVSEQVEKAIEDKAQHILVILSGETQKIRVRFVRRTTRRHQESQERVFTINNECMLLNHPKVIKKEPKNEKIKQFIDFLQKNGQEMKQMDEEDEEERKEIREEELQGSDYDSNDDSDEDPAPPSNHVATTSTTNSTSKILKSTVITTKPANTGISVAQKKTGCSQTSNIKKK